MPVLSFGLRYNITPRFHWYLKSEFFSIAFDQWDGIYTDTQLGLEYRLTDYLGLGTGIGGNSLTVTEDTSDYRFNYENRITGIMFYIAGYY